MSVYLKPTSVIKARLGINPSGHIQSFFTNTCYKEMDRFVPMRDGNLRDIVDIQTDSITYQSEYAGYQYYGQRKDGSHVVSNYTTPGTGPFWDKRMWSVKKADIIKAVEKELKRGG